MKKAVLPGIVGLIIVWLIYSEYNKPKVGYISIKEVFNGFNMKNELQQQYEKTKQAREKILDSSEVRLKLMAARLQELGPGKDRNLESEFAVLRDEFFRKKQAFEEDDRAMIEQADRQIMDQLNQYINDFGSENNYEVIFGAGDDGNIMYAATEKNITKKVVEFVNLKYSGKK